MPKAPLRNAGQHVIVYRTKFPLPSEAFIPEQIAAYSRYRPIILCRDYVGNRASAASGVRHIEGNFNRLRFSVTGFMPRPLWTDADIVHAHFAPDGLFAVPLAARMNVPLVVTCHGSDVTRPRSQLLRTARPADLRYLIGLPKLKRSASLVIAVSEFIKQILIDRGYPSGKIVRHYIGVDPDKLRPREGEIRDPLHIISVARHERVKGVDVLLQAVAVAAVACPGLRLSQVGAGSCTAELKMLCRTLGIEERVKFLGALPHEETVKVIQSGGTLVLSSRKAEDGSEEALGIAILEASACGVPVVGTRTGGIPEVVKHRRTGVLVEPESIHELADAITFLARNAWANNDYGANGRRMILTEFDIRKQTALLEDYYDEAREQFAKR